VHTATIYRWLRLWEASGHLPGLVPSKGHPAVGSSRLPPAVDEIVTATIKEKYLDRQRRRAEDVSREIVQRCRTAGLRPPHSSTVRRRIAALPEELKVRRREGWRAAAAAFEPIKGSFPGADSPLAVVQIDHTTVDVEIVDDVHLASIGRPWLTVAVDVFSRMVAGFYVSLDPPGALSVGLCLAHAILRKDAWLAKLGIETSWPVWGVMKTVHADNGKEFHGRMLELACRNRGIELKWRPVRTPRYGGHIERLIGTLMQKVHSLDGTTFSNIREKGTYDSAKKASMTLKDLERWLATYIVGSYHQDIHASLGVSPLKRYQDGILGVDGQPGRGLPDVVVDEMRLRLDFMPYVERTVQQYGILLDEVQYWDPVLRPWINAKDPAQPGRKRHFIIRRDPRDISVVHFFDPDSKEHLPIPYRNTRPAISLWEFKAARRALKKEGRRNVDEAAIFDAHEKMNAIADAAREKKRSTLRAGQRRRHHKESRPTPVAPSGATPVDDEIFKDVRPFEDMREGDD
jgi:putative transposase